MRYYTAFNMKDGVKIYCLILIFLIASTRESVRGEVRDGLPVVSISDLNQDTPLPEEEILVPVQRINAGGEIIAEYEITLHRIDPNTGIPSEDPDDPPQYDADLILSTMWQTTGPEQFEADGCRVYRMILAADHKYNFSLCSTDGVGGYSLGDADLEMIAADGSLLWYIDGQSRCDWAASTLGTTWEDWLPTVDDVYYLRVSDYNISSLQYNLAYRGVIIRDPNLRVEPSILEFDCTNSNSSVSASQDNLTFEIEANPNENADDPMDKLILAEEILNRLEGKQAKVRVIVNLQKPAELKRNVKRRARGAWRTLRQEIAQRQLEVIGTLLPREFQSRRRFANLNSFSGEVTAEGLVQLLDDSRVKSIEPVFELQAHLRQGISLMNAPDVRTNYRGQGMAIAIVDTGIDYTHSVLGDGGFPNTKVLGGYDFGDDDPDPFAGASHGTSCAGIAAGDLADVGDYIGGVAHEAKLYALKISPGITGSASSDDMIAAWDWCVTHQYDDPNHPIMVISTSFGGGRYLSHCDDSDTAMTMAAKNANAAGITVLVSSGNDGYCESLAWPACLSNVISVGAVYDSDFGSASWCVNAVSCADVYSSGGCSTNWAADDSTAVDKVAVYSNTAPFLDILAPSNQVYTTTIGGYVSNFGGTSAACPYAAGAVACLQSAAKHILGLYLTPDEVRQILSDTGDPITDTKVDLTKPRINLAQAVEAITCSGQVLYLYNDGEAVLEVNDVIAPDGITLSPEPPYSIEGGSRLRICVGANCNQCYGQDLIDVMYIYGNDPKHNSEPYEIVVRQHCPVSSLPGDFDADTDVDLMDYAHFSRYWLRRDCREPDWCDNADLNRDGRVNIADLMVFLTAWSNQ